jgi:hypothetical protein
MSEPLKSPGEDVTIRCPRLGQMITFSYCRSENQGLPCFKAIDCWFEHFPAAPYFQRVLSGEQWQKVFCCPVKPKMSSLLEIIQAAKEQKKASP